MKRAWGWSLAGFLVITCVIMALMQLSRTPHFESVKSAYKSTDRAILDRNGLIIDEIHREKYRHRFNWVELDDVPRFLRRALLAEDADLAAQMAAWQGGRSGEAHWREWLRAKILDWSWKKTELAEAYINLAVFRGELQGISAASFGLFDKTPEELSKGEAAVIMALQSQTRAQGITETACDWVKRMDAPEECGLLSQDHLSQIEKSYRITPFVRMAPHFTEKLKRNPEIARGSVVRSTLDRDLQWSAIQSLQARGLFNSAVIVIENQTGNILVYVNNVTAAADMVVHPAGASLQPLIYAQAIEERVLTAASMLENSALALSTARYRPPRRDLVSVREALSLGMSIPAVQAMNLVGESGFSKTLGLLGIGGFENGDAAGPSLALGSVSVPLLELTNAYRALANGGVWSPLRLSPDKLSEKGSKRVFSPETAFIVGDILADHNGRVVFSDPHWSVGYSNRYTVGVWAGREKASLGLWQEIANHLHQRDPVEPPHAPKTLVRNVVVTAKKEIRDEWFIAGTEPHETDLAAVPSRISYPQNHSTIELDQRRRENLLIKIVAPGTDQNLYLNGERLGRAKSYLPWEPHSGKFTLELRDSRGQVLDRVRFEVRGRSFARAW